MNAGYDVVVADNYSNSSPESIKRVEQITGKCVKLYEADIRDNAKLTEIFRTNSIDVVIHFAGLKAVGESVQKPLMYYRNNIDTTAFAVGGHTGIQRQKCNLFIQCNGIW